MRHKLALTIALACFGIVTALGVGFAGAEQLSSAQPTETSGLSTVPSVAEAPACANGLDDDADGTTDAEDADCASPAHDTGNSAGASRDSDSNQSATSRLARSYKSVKTCGLNRLEALIHCALSALMKSTKSRSDRIGFPGGGGTSPSR